MDQLRKINLDYTSVFIVKTLIINVITPLRYVDQRTMDSVKDQRRECCEFSGTLEYGKTVFTATGTHSHRAMGAGSGFLRRWAQSLVSR